MRQVGFSAFEQQDCKAVVRVTWKKTTAVNIVLFSSNKTSVISWLLLMPRRCYVRRCSTENNNNMQMCCNMLQGTCIQPPLGFTQTRGEY